MTQELILKAELQPTPEMTTMLASTAEAVIDDANALVVDSATMADIANDEMRQAKAQAKRLKELRDLFVAPAKQIIDTADGMFKPRMEALLKAEGIYKAKLLEWTAEQRRLADEARRKAEAEARRQREEAEARAAAERARAEQVAAQKRREAEEAEKARQQAEAEGNKRAAQAAAANAAKLEEEARQAAGRAEAKIAEVTLTAAAAAPVVAAVQTAPAGFSARKNWVAELENDVTAERAVQMIAKAIAEGRNELITLLKLDMSAATKLAKAQEQHMSVPGLRAVNRPIATSRAA
ncbi:MAG: hypothetical protein ING91_19325 [Rhodocyclaceae bacterium]|nr:hypothetical protein [Rhodocyclaceae bacterium]MCA3116386.1 hypothetical protein [Rhodocyclaceae bacterium]MCA3127061.1 hypothetical protein [Rhodocyclaceae bacterium]